MNILWSRKGNRQISIFKVIISKEISFDVLEIKVSICKIRGKDKKAE